MTSQLCIQLNLLYIQLSCLTFPYIIVRYMQLQAALSGKLQKKGNKIDRDLVNEISAPQKQSRITWRGDKSERGLECLLPWVSEVAGPLFSHEGRLHPPFCLVKCLASRSSKKAVCEGIKAFNIALCFIYLLPLTKCLSSTNSAG